MTKRSPIRVVVVDDEPLARERLRTLLDARRDVEVVAECGDGADAVQVIGELRPDLVLLDVQMPELDGFEVLEALRSLEPPVLPAVVFVTAYDAYAIRAFEVRALDYLLKPFDRARFEDAIDRAVERLGATAIAGDAVGELLAALRAERGGAWRQRFVVRQQGRIAFVRTDDVDWIDAEGNYVRLHVGGRTHLVRDTMKAVESQLDPDRFVRVHRSAIVNVDRIASMEPYFHGEYVVTMRDGSRLTSSRSHGGRLRALLK
jgi:two-component system, LytTR family, response regulator